MDSHLTIGSTTSPLAFLGQRGSARSTRARPIRSASPSSSILLAVEGDCVKEGDVGSKTTYAKAAIQELDKARSFNYYK